MGKWRTFFVILLVGAGGGSVHADDSVAISDDSDEQYAAPWRDAHASASSLITGQNLSDGPSDASDLQRSDETPLTSQIRQPGEFLVSPAPQISSTDIVPALPIVPRLIESTIYTRFDYLNWSARDHTIDQGPLYTLGYQRRVGRERFRTEVFGSQTWEREAFLIQGQRESVVFGIVNMGGRFEYDFLFQPDWARRVTFFGGIGTRFWVHSPPDYVDAVLALIRISQVSWVTVYPYIGLETRRDETRRAEWYGRARVGILAGTIEHDMLLSRTFFPGPGVTGQAELGIRGDRLFLAGYFEVFAWPKTPETFGGSHITQFIQPPLTLLTVGLKTGVTF
jgi:hypothetical protein